MPKGKSFFIIISFVFLLIVGLFFVARSFNLLPFVVKPKDSLIANNITPSKFAPTTILKSSSSDMILDKSNVLFLKVYDPSVSKDWSDFKLVWGYITKDALPNQQNFTNKNNPQLIIVAAGGYKNTGGFSIQIDSVEYNSSKELVAVVSETSPGKNCIVTQAFTKSYYVASIPKKVYTSLKPDFKSVREKECK